MPKPRARPVPYSHFRVELGRASIGAQQVPVLEAELTRFISTEAWSADEQRWIYPTVSLEYVLELHLPDHAWDVLDLDPDVRVWVTELPTPTMDALVGTRLDQLGKVSAWAGHDGGELHDVSLTLVAQLDPTTIEVRLEATGGRDDAPLPISYAGAVHLPPLTTKVKDPADADHFLAKVHGHSAVPRAVRTDGQWRELGESYPPDRRRWLEVSYVV